MLGTTIWMTVALALLATAVLDAAAAFGRASAHAAAGHAVEAAMQDAVADVQARLATAMAATTAADAPSRAAAALAPLPNPVVGAAALPNAAPGTSWSAGYEVAQTTAAMPACAADGGSTGADAVAWLQCAPDVAESRVSLRATVRVTDAAGAVVARREQYVTLRVFALPPYSAVVGRMDGATVAVPAADAEPPHEGDVGGDTVSGVTPSAAPSPWPAAGTLIHVRYECHDGAGACANAAPPDPDAALRAGIRWQNGNRPPP